MVAISPDLGHASLFSRKKTALLAALPLLLAALPLLLAALLLLLLAPGCAPRPEPVKGPAPELVEGELVEGELVEGEPVKGLPVKGTPTPEPLVPTVPAGLSKNSPSLSSLPVAEASAALSLPAVPPAGRQRFGVGVALAAVNAYSAQPLGVGWYLNWQVVTSPPRPGGMEFWQMIRVSQAGYRPGDDAIRQAAAANPGSVWLIGNEPDVQWQDNVTPERYAQLYHDLYTLLKTADPACRVAIAGVSQPTPLRLAYLDRILSTYQASYGQPIPVDIWNVHNFILREEKDSWGVGIPPGADAATGILYDIDDHDNLQHFQNQILAFRRWMAQRGQRDKPLVVSEYGLLMPVDYGFDTGRVQTFMTASFDYFLAADDASIGYPQDDNRLVQWWCWYSLSDTVYSAGNLINPTSRSVTPLGLAFANYRSP